MQKMLDFLEMLDQHKIHYHLERNRTEAIMVLVAVPGERWEVEFFADGSVEVETFVSNQNGIKGEEALSRLFADNKD